VPSWIVKRQLEINFGDNYFSTVFLRILLRPSK